MTVDIKALVGKKHDAEKRMQDIFDAGGAELKLSAQQRDEIKAIDKELADLQDQITLANRALDNEKSLKEYEKPEYKFSPSRGEMDNKAAEKDDTRTIAQKMLDSAQYKNRALNSGNFSLEIPNVELKTLMTLAAGFAPPNYRTDIVVPYALRPLMVQDLFPTVNTNLQIVYWMEETTHTNNAAVVAEGNAATDSAYAYTVRSATMEKITGWLPVTDEQLEDVDGIQAIITSDLMYDVNKIAEDEVTTGTYGVLSIVGQTQALGALSQPDAFAKAITLCRGGAGKGFSEPDAGIIHPNDWYDIWTLQDADGNYIWGSPAMPPAQPRIWGIPMAVTTAITENSAVIGAFRQWAKLWIKRGLTIEMSDSHSTYFTEGKKVIKATTRLIPTFGRPDAFVSVTGL